jgi:hypothetical protein
MNNKYSATFVLAMLMAVCSAFSQNPSCPDGFSWVNATSSYTRTSGNVPFFTTSYGYPDFCNNSRTWSVFSRSDLYYQGITSESYINRIGIDVHYSTNTVQNVRIYMREAHTIISAADTIPLDSMQLVFSSSSLSFSNGCNNIDLDSVFHYSGSGHLMVAFSGEYYNPVGITFGATSSISAYRYEDCSGGWHSGLINCRPVLSFGACVDTVSSQNLPPQGLACQVLGDDIVVSFSSPAQQFQIVAGIEGFIPDTISSSYPFQKYTTSLTDTLPVPAYNSRIDVYARVVTGDSGAIWSMPVTVVSGCGIVSTPYQMYVSSDDFDLIEACFTLHNVSFTTSGNTYFSTIDTNKPSIVVLPQFDVPINETRLQFFNYYQSLGHYETIVENDPNPFEIGYITDPDDSTTFVPLDSLVSLLDCIIPLAADLYYYNGSASRLAIRRKGLFFRLLEVNWGESLCYPPYHPSVSVDNNGNTVMNWRGHPENPDHYLFQIEGVSTSFFTGFYSNSCLNVLDSLEPGALYRVRARTYCISHSNGSVWSQWFYFTAPSPDPQTYTATGLSADPSLGSVSVSPLAKDEPNSGSYYEGTMLSFLARPIADYVTFDHWDDGDTNNPRVVTLTSDTTLVAYFVSMPRFNAVGLSADSSQGIVSVALLEGEVFEDERYSEGSVIEFLAEPISEGTLFLQWDDGETVNPRVITLVSDTTLVAYFFAGDSVGINSDFNKLCSNLIISPNPADGLVSVCVSEPIVSLACYDLSGRSIMTLINGSNTLCETQRTTMTECCSVDVSTWPAGQYVIRIVTPTSNYVGRLIVR